MCVCVLAFLTRNCTAQKVVNPLFLATIIGDFQSPAPNTLSCRAGERVVIIGKEGDWSEELPLQYRAIITTNT